MCERLATQRSSNRNLLRIFLDYGKNPQVDHVICLVYDPGQTLKAPAAVQMDLSGPKDGLSRVEVVVSPPRD